MNDRAEGTVASSEKPADNGAAPYEATPQEKAAIERFRDRRRQKKPTPRFSRRAARSVCRVPRACP